MHYAPKMKALLVKRFLLTLLVIVVFLVEGDCAVVLL